MRTGIDYNNISRRSAVHRLGLGFGTFVPKTIPISYCLDGHLFKFMYGVIPCFGISGNHR